MKRKCLKSSLLASLMALGWLTLFTQSSPAQEMAKKVITVEGITEYRLDNGFRYLLFPDPSSATVTVNLTVFVGSRHEGYGETGMAHLLEHMLFKGSTKFPEIDKALEKHGARDYNGTTYVDRTNYYETMPAGDENLKFAIEFEADRMINSFVRREDLAKEMTVVRNEFERGENNPVSILRQRILAAAFEWHNYGKTTIGNRTDIERVPIENLQAFYKKFYQPDNSMLVVAGQFDQAKAHKYIADTFGKLPRPERDLGTTYTEEPAQDGERTVVLRRVGKQTVVGVLYHTPAAGHPSCASVDVLAQVLGSSPSGRLYKSLVETKKAVAVGGFATAFHDPGYLLMLALVSDKSSPEEVKEILLKELEDITENSITEKEVDRARKELLAERARALANSKGIAIELSEWAGAGDWRLMFLHRDRIEDATAKQVNQAALDYLKASNRTYGVFLPTEAKDIARAEIPATPELDKLLKDYKGGKGLAKGEAFEVTPENIENRVKRTKLPVGTQVVVLPKKTRGEKVVLSLSLRFGTEKTLLPFTDAAGFLGSLMERGTENYNYNELQEKLDALGATMDVSSGDGYLTVSIEAKRDTIEETLDLMEEVLRKPTFPEKEFGILHRASLQGQKTGLTDPQTLAITRLKRKLNPYPKTSIHYVPTVEESIERTEKVTRDQVVQIYKELLGADHSQLAIVGDFDVKATVGRVAQILDGWKSKADYAPLLQTPNTKVKGGKEVIEVPDKKNAMYFAGYLMALKDSDPNYPAMKMANHVLGGSGFTSLLMDNLREKQGLSYGAGSLLYVGTDDDYTRFFIYASCNPDNIKKVDEVTFKVLNKAKKEGVSEEQVTAAVKGYLAQQKLSRSNDSSLATTLRQLEYLNRTFDHYAEMDQRFEKLSVEEVNSALRELVQPDRLVVIEAGDFRKKSEKK